ncbi:MAG: DUF2807 domain-containing protein [candidate division Zixibacteria bacterium]|nr:DUF2807 domain-containing protein [candidate division Zixibacteria bacterium]
MKKQAIRMVAALAAWLAVSVPSVAADDVLSRLFGRRGVEGSGELVTEARHVKPFTKVISTGSSDIYISVGGEQKVEVTYDDNLIDMVRTEVRGAKLKIYIEGSHSSRHSSRIDITVPKLEEVRCTGSGDIEVVDLDQDFFAYKLSGSGDFRAAGRVAELELTLSGSGEIDTRDLIANEAYCTISGSGRIRVAAAEAFDGTVSGSGDIYYYGKPESVSRHVTGSGSIKRR